MSKTYHMEKISAGSYPCIIFSTSYISPMDQLETVEDDLKKIGVVGNILFDLLLSHGNTPDRFYEALFNGKKIDINSLKRVESISENIKQICTDFYHNHVHFLKNSILSSPQKFLIKKRIGVNSGTP